MNKFGNVLLLFLLFSLCGYAQIGMNLKAERERYLRYEPIN